MWRNKGTTEEAYWPVLLQELCILKMLKWRHFISLLKIFSHKSLHRKVIPDNTSKVQHSFKVTFARIPERVSDASCTRSRRVLEVSCIWQKKAWHSHKSPAALSEVLRLHRHISCTFQTHRALVPDSSWTHSRRVPDECEHYFEVKLYLIYLTTAKDLQWLFESE